MSPSTPDDDWSVASSSEAFMALGNETRMAILLALWNAKVPGDPISEHALPFSALRERVGVQDSGQFNYHLEKLVGRYIRRTDEGYVLRQAGDRLVRAVVADTFTTDVSFQDVAIDMDCPTCGADVVVDYEDQTLVVRCSDCAGNYRFADYPEGTLSAHYLPPVALENRTPREVYHSAQSWIKSRSRAMLEGVCPSCSSSVDATLVACEDHATGEDGACNRCGSAFELRMLRACTVCKNDWWFPAWSSIFADTRVVSFYHDHGIDTASTDYVRVPATIESQRVEAEDPLRLHVDIDVDGDHLAVVLDEEGDVVDVVA